MKTISLFKVSAVCVVLAALIVLMSFGALTIGSADYSLKQIADAPLPWKSRYLASMLLTSFGGFCVMAQTKSVLENSLSLIPYAISKCLNASAIFLILVFSDIV